MAPNKSLDEIRLVASLLHDVHRTYGVVFNSNALRNTIKIVERRVSTEGMSFLRKTLPRLAKALDKALAGHGQFNCSLLRFHQLKKGSKLPRFLGELFELVFDHDGTVLQEPCVRSIRFIRDICYLFYKYEVPCEPELERAVVRKFEQTENDLIEVTKQLQIMELQLVAHAGTSRQSVGMTRIARRARRLISSLFAWFDPLDIQPRHGPGVVSTKETPWFKYRWTNVSEGITNFYPFDAYFCASQGHVCDTFSTFFNVTDKSLPAEVKLVPKDSRGPRLISAEPVDYQWIQQGLRRSIYRLVEEHPLTKGKVLFTDQGPNQRAALRGSIDGHLSTLDLAEASDRISLDLVRLLFPEHIFVYLNAARSLSTRLPDGRIINLKKFAPMGSALCFPVMAICIWALLTAGASDRETRNSLLVYGDDVVVKTAYAEDAINILESFGLKINRDKSCTSGFFRESCGTDAFKGEVVTPVRIRTVWSSSRTPSSYESWIEYSNQLYERKYYTAYNYIVSCLTQLYGEIPEKSMNLSCPSLVYVPPESLPRRHRTNHSLQKREWKVWVTRAPKRYYQLSGWEKLLRYFAETLPEPVEAFRSKERQHGKTGPFEARFNASSYTLRGTSMLVKRWV